ncbi:MAG: hypothetical protein HYX92_10575 [Chloroflexi bacterium]|nr:hypothetical protein [Chloroflexota bacterium]
MFESVTSGTGVGAESFEAYYSALLTRAPKVAPSAGEARKEYLRQAELLAALQASIV